MKAFVFILLSALSFSFIYSQRKEKNDDLFRYDVLNFYSPEGTKSRIDIYVEVPMGKLIFKRSKKDKSLFVSKFDLVIDVKDSEGKIVYNNISKEEVTAPEINQEFLSQNSHILTRNLFLPPGEYDLKVSINERSTQKFTEKQRKIQVKDYVSKPLSISDVMIVSRITQTTDKKVITPDVGRNVGHIDTFYLFYYIYNSSDEGLVDVNCRILDNEKKEVFSKKEIINSKQGNSFQNQLFMSFPTYDLKFGQFTIEIKAEGKEHTALETAAFENRSEDFPLPLLNIDELISQLQYIAKDEEMDYMRNGKTDEDKQRRFLEFWKKKDPNPSTKRNEVMQEYYRRLITANKRFTNTYMQGWKTDMGMVFIIFGEPSNIDRHPYDMDTKPYEVWEYFDINKQFVFVDNSGFGDYRLITPIWETFRYQR